MTTWLRPFYSVGLLFSARDPASLSFLGSCFAYLTKRHFVTAAHCLGKLEPHEVRIVLPLVAQEDLGVVSAICRHPEADVAVLETPEDADDDLAPFRGVSALQQWGEDVNALGYPEESDAEITLPTARLFTGSVQRYYTYTSHMPYRYKAGELSFGSPAGLSGGPVFPRGEQDRIIGVVTENCDSTTFLRSVAEIQDGGQRYTEKVHEVIRYGIFARLDPLSDWLGDHCRT